MQYNPAGDKVILTVSSKSLINLRWKGDTANISSAYLVGFIAGKKAAENGIKEAVFDIGPNNSVKGSRLYSALAGALDAGLEIPCNHEVLPPKERISGEHIVKYAHILKNNRQVYDKYFSNYLKRGLAPEDTVKHFNEIKGKIHG